MTLNHEQRYLIRRALNYEALAVLDLEQKALAAGDGAHAGGTGASVPTSARCPMMTTGRWPNACTACRAW